MFVSALPWEVSHRVDSGCIHVIEVPAATTSLSSTYSMYRLPPLKGSQSNSPSRSACRGRRTCQCSQPRRQLVVHWYSGTQSRGRSLAPPEVSDTTIIEAAVGTLVGVGSAPGGVLLGSELASGHAHLQPTGDCRAYA